MIVQYCKHLISSATKIAIFLPLFLHANLAGADAAKDLENQIVSVAGSLAWQNLLYYNSKGKSLVSNEIFFLNGDQGPTNALAELRANIKAFTEDPPAHQPNPQCRFPARYQLLKQYFQLSPPVSCPQFDQWVREYQPKDITLVYASQFISSPASVFGHSFLVLPSDTQKESLWLTYNYSAAMPPKVGPFDYVVGGIAGWFSGTYTVMPYYNRLYQYGSIENRDLWLYTIRMTPEERDFSIRHLWELVHAGTFTYFFMDENCAGALLRFFAAVLPDMREGRDLPIYVHPIEVIQRLDRAGRIAKFDFLPSQVNVLQNAIGTLSPDQHAVFDSLVDSPEHLPAQAEPAVTETLMDYLAFQKLKNYGELPTEWESLNRWAHIQRSKYQEAPIVFDKSEELTMAPHFAHRSSSAQVGASLLRGEAASVDLQVRFSLHNLLDPEPGFIKNSTVDCLNTKISIHGDQVWIQELIIAKMENLLPIRRYDLKPSWRIEAAVKENLLTENLRDQFVQVDSAVGGGVDIKKLYLYAFAAADFNFGNDLPQADIEAGPELGTVLSLGKFKIFARARSTWDASGLRSSTQTKVSSGMRWILGRDLIVVQETEWNRINDPNLEGYRASLGVRTYF